MTPVRGTERNAGMLESSLTARTLTEQLVIARPELQEVREAFLKGGDSARSGTGNPGVGGWGGLAAQAFRLLRRQHQALA